MLLQIVIDEYNTCKGGSDGGSYQSISQMMFVDPATGDLPKCTDVIPELRDRVLEAMAEHKAEVEQRFVFVRVLLHYLHILVVYRFMFKYFWITCFFYFTILCFKKDK